MDITCSFDAGCEVKWNMRVEKLQEDSLYCISLFDWRHVRSEKLGGYLRPLLELQSFPGNVIHIRYDICYSKGPDAPVLFFYIANSTTQYKSGVIKAAAKYCVTRRQKGGSYNKRTFVSNSDEAVNLKKSKKVHQKVEAKRKRHAKNEEKKKKPGQQASVHLESAILKKAELHLPVQHPSGQSPPWNTNTPEIAVTMMKNRSDTLMLTTPAAKFIRKRGGQCINVEPIGSWKIMTTNSAYGLILYNSDLRLLYKVVIGDDSTKSDGQVAKYEVNK
jgi:hypothetical protein